MINTALQTPFHTPAIGGASSVVMPEIDVRELTTVADGSSGLEDAIDNAIDDAIARGSEQAPALAANLLRMLNENPEALDLYLANVAEQRQRDLNSALSITTYANANAANSPADPLGKFGKVLETVNSRNDVENGAILGNYTKYMVAYTELSTKINTLIRAETDEKKAGKSVVQSEQIIKAISDFCITWGVKTDPTTQKQLNVLQSFSEKSEADEAAKRFRGGTVEVFEDYDRQYSLRFSFKKLIPIIEALVIDPIKMDTAASITEPMLDGRPPFTHFWEGHKNNLKSSGVNAHGVQTITLALADVQKTHQTDLDLVLNEFTRQTSQFDNLVKLYSSLATALTETLKSFL